MVQPIHIHIVTPGLNAARCIERTIASVLTQAGDFALHYHVQDGGSTDETLDIVKRWKDRLESGVLPLFCRSIDFTYASAPDDGPRDAICRAWAGRKMADGDWMAWVNAGDMLAVGACALLVRIDASHSQRGVQWVTGSAVITDEGRGAVPLASAGFPQADDPALSEQANILPGAGSFFRHIVWKEQDVENEFRRYDEDWNLWRSMARDHVLHRVDWPLGHSRSRVGQEAQLDDGGEAFDHRADRAIRSHIALRYLDADLTLRPVDLAPYLRGGMGRASGPVHDADWQYPAETERHAYRKVADMASIPPDTVYFAFPWATLIDRLHNDTPDAPALLQHLQRLSGETKNARHVVTVCQHVRMLACRDLFELAGITDIFWPHAIKGMGIWPGPPPINLHPFPLFPVQVQEAVEFRDDERRDCLYNFLGAISNDWYLSDVRDHIVRELADDPRGMVRGRLDWHYDKIVYQHQIHKWVGSDQPLIDEGASAEFRDLLTRSTFTLCPSGSGPNSIRLWEAIGAGSIPVIMADTFTPPGNQDLWREAALFCGETLREVRALPRLLADIAGDPETLARKRRALRQLWSLYGPDNFIHDIRLFFLEGCRPASGGERTSRPAAGPAPVVRTPVKVCLFGRHSNRTPLSYEPYEELYRDRVRFVDAIEMADVVISGFEIDFHENAEALCKASIANPSLKFAIFSEEPLWDTLWSRSFGKPFGEIVHGGHRVKFQIFNHADGSLFDWSHIPYFLTTSGDYSAVYSHLFARNAAQRVGEVLEQWRAAPVRAAFYAEKREGKDYDVSHAGGTIRGLSVFRTDMASAFDGPADVRVGKGWNDAPVRQTLASWHLDKLCALDRRVFIMSAIENTHQKTYVTEKLFDAFAIGAVPVYAAARDHGVHRIVKGGFLNVDGLTPAQAVDSIRAFVPTDAFAQEWLNSQARLANLFADSGILWRERRRVADQVVDALHAMMAGDDLRPASLREVAAG
ncbi:MAG: exostosin family protein [Sphingobium sp.]